jgi:hypothetical protein
LAIFDLRFAVADAHAHPLLGEKRDRMLDLLALNVNGFAGKMKMLENLAAQTHE